MPPEQSTPKIVSPYNRPDDEFGYAVYSIVVMASLAQQAAIDHVRRVVRNQRSMIPAHVTVKGTFCEIPSINAIIKNARKVADNTGPFRVEFESSTDRRGNTFAGQRIKKTPGLVTLHDRLYDALAPITTNAYAREDGDHYRPHMSVYAEPTPGFEHAADEMLTNLDIGTGFDCDAMFLMGHIGPPYRGRWTVVREFLLRG
ncbi:MAG: 2'-5' RNA ligase family protein [Dehalococcoidia bacterium]|jgi:hypothetical protein|nr:2'-5' RNA ligase family protein [Dehalococcoidia bacterium]